MKSDLREMLGWLLESHPGALAIALTVILLGLVILDEIELNKEDDDER